jgi:hypothetical protein
VIITLKNDAATGQIWLDDKPLDLPSQEVLRIVNLSGGFAWSIGDFGAALISLAVLLKFTDERTALENYQDFKWEIISQLGPGDFEVEINISPWITRREVVQ